MPVRAIGPDRSRARSVSTSTPAPVGGWNVRDSIAAMKPEFATRLDNWFPDQSEVRVRRGHAQHTEDGDVDGDVESLMAWNGPSSSKLFAAAAGSIYNATTPGAASEDVTSLASNRWQHVMFGTSGGKFLYIVNGSDAPRYYDGSAWTVPTITGSGLTAANLIHINVFKNRIFFVEKDTLNAWYFPVETIAGSISKLDFGPFCRKGGHLVAMATWSIDGGTGLDDYAVFVTSKGEFLIYQGSDPSSTSGWFLVGVFDLGAPVGRRCFMKLGGDLCFLTLDGFIMLSSSMISSRTNTAVNLSDKISRAVKDVLRDRADNFGWQPIFYPRGNYALVNVPIQENGSSHQYVINTTTRAWCRFIGQDAFCWEIYNDELYFGGTDNVYKADTGLDDNGADIRADARTAFTYFNRRGQIKQMSMIRPMVTVDGSLYAAIAVNMDFEDVAPTAVPTFTSDEGEEWDDAEWDVASWGVGATVNKDWQSVTGLGYAAALRMKVVANNGSISWQATDWIWQPGGVI